MVKDGGGMGMCGRNGLEVKMSILRYSNSKMMSTTVLNSLFCTTKLGHVAEGRLQRI